MTTSANSASVNITAQAYPISIPRQAAIFLIIEFLLIFAPLIILGAAINWPNWLGWFGLIVAASLLLNLLEMIGIDMGQ